MSFEELDNSISKAIGYAETLLEDCEAQYFTLLQTNDVDWDCYNPNHWANHVEMLQAIISLLKHGKDIEGSL